MSKFLRDNIRRMSGYVPGEQPRDDSYIKLNTNENPYPPSPRVLEAVRETLTGDRLRKYPDPVGTSFRQTAGRVLGVDPDAILIGNGSDDILTILTRTLVPEGGLVVSPTPSYLLYRTLSEIQGARFQTVPFTADWQLPQPWPAPQASITFLANPNSPSGTLIAPAALERLVAELNGPIVVDEAYVDFADNQGMHQAAAEDRTSQLIVTRSLSKSYSLAGIRFGYAVGQPSLIRELIKVKDSYNCDVLSLAAATAALDDQKYFLETQARIVATRERMTEALQQLGFEVCPSQANFVWCLRPPHPSLGKGGQGEVKPIYEELKRRMILIRYMNYEGYGDGLRISVGTDSEIDKLLEELRQIV